MSAEGRLLFEWLEGAGVVFETSGGERFDLANAEDFYGGNLSLLMRYRSDETYRARVSGWADTCVLNWGGPPLWASSLVAEVPDLRVPYWEVVPVKNSFSVSEPVEFKATLKNPSSLPFRFFTWEPTSRLLKAGVVAADGRYVGHALGDTNLSADFEVAPFESRAFGHLVWNQTAADGFPACAPEVHAGYMEGLTPQLELNFTAHVILDEAFEAKCSSRLPWSDAQEMLEGGPFESHPTLVATANGTLVMAWASGTYTCNECRVLVSRSTDGGFHWSVPQALTPLSPILNADPAPTLAVAGDGTLVLAFVRTEMFDRGDWWPKVRLSVGIMRSSDGGLSWTPATFFDPPAEDELMPRLLARPNGSLQLFTGGNWTYENVRKVFARESMDGGATWSAPNLVLNSSWIRHIVLGADSRGSVNLYLYSGEGLARNFSILSSPDGVNWSAVPMLVHSSDSWVDTPYPLAAAVGPGNDTWLLVLSFAGYFNDLWLWQRAPGEMNWTAPDRITRTTAREGDAALLSGPGGAMWILSEFIPDADSTHFQLRCTPATDCPQPSFAP